MVLKCYDLTLKMAEKISRRMGIIPSRVAVNAPKIILASKFSIRKDRLGDGIVEFLFEPTEKGLPIQKLAFDLTILITHLDSFKQYAVALQGDEDDGALSSEIPSIAEGAFANIATLTHMGKRAEIAFGFVSLNDWANASRKATKENCEVDVDIVDVIIVFCTVPFQKKFILELLTAVQSG